MMMTHSLPFRIIPEQNLVFVEAVGVVTLYEVYQHLLHVIQHADFKMGMNALYDFRQAERLIGDENIIKRTATSISDQSLVSKPAKTAILLPENNADIHSMAERYVELTEQSVMSFKIFEENQIEDALNYVSIDSMPHLSKTNS